jgi:phenylacetate-coenzyme A ligase PaaK-like adenylate-forming protein
MDCKNVLEVDKVRNLERPINSKILSNRELEDSTSEKEYSNAIVFESSGTTGKPKRIPYSEEILDTQREHESKAFKIGGLTKHDTVMTLAAPLNSISGWASRSGSRELGAEVLNRSFNDYKKVIESKENNDVTAIFATPLVAKTIGEEIKNEYGRPDDIFPNLRIGFMFGDLLPDSLRKDLKRQWGFQELRSLYGSVEADVIAIQESESEKLVPMLDRIIVEIIPYENGEKQDRIQDIRDVERKIEGSILITDPLRRKINITRYEIGDMIRVYPDDPVPKIEVLGRIDSTINLGGAPLHEKDLQIAIDDTYSVHVETWKVIVSRKNSKPAIDVYIAGDIDEKKDEFLNNLFEIAPPVKEAYSDIGSGVIEHINLVIVDDKEEITDDIEIDKIENDAKSERIIFSESF